MRCRPAPCARPSGCCGARRAPAVLESDRRRGRGLRRAPAEPGSEGSVQCLLREAQARLLALLNAPRRRPAGWPALAGSSSRSRRCSSPRRWRRGVARRVLPEAEGAREGVVGDADAPPLRLLVAGDSSAAGVGVARQEQAVVGHLVRTLQRAIDRPHRLGAARAHRADDARRPRLLDGAAVRRRCRRRHHRRQRRHRPGDDAARGARPRRARRLAARRAGVRHVVFAPLPPVHRFPLLPEPLRRVLGGDARRHDAALRAGRRRATTSRTRASRSSSTPPAWRATASIPASRSTAPAAKRSRRTSPGWSCHDVAAALADRRRHGHADRRVGRRRRRSSPAFRRASCSRT